MSQMMQPYLALPDAVVVLEVGVDDAQRAVAVAGAAGPLVLAGEDADGVAALFPAALALLVVDAAGDVDGAARVHLLVAGLRQPRLNGARCNRKKFPMIRGLLRPPPGRLSVKLRVVSLVARNGWLEMCKM